MAKQSDNPRDETDRYITPYGLCRDMVRDHLPDKPRRVLDPGAGWGYFGAAIREVYGDEPHITGVELLDDVPPAPWYDRWVVDNFLTVSMGTYDLVIGNPPFKIITEFIYKGMTLLEEGGTMLILMRLGLLESDDRNAGLWVDYPLHTLIPLADRPSFFHNGKTDGHGYALYKWVKGDDNGGRIIHNWRYDRTLYHPRGGERTTAHTPRLIHAQLPLFEEVTR